MGLVDIHGQACYHVHTSPIPLAQILGPRSDPNKRETIQTFLGSTEPCDFRGRIIFMSTGWPLWWYASRGYGPSFECAGGTPEEYVDVTPLAVGMHSFLTSALGQGCDIPMIIRVRGHLDAIRRPMKGDCYTGRGSRQRGLHKSIAARHNTESRQRSENSGTTCRKTRFFTRSSLTLSGLRLVCHCLEWQSCDAHVIEELKKSYRQALRGVGEERRLQSRQASSTEEGAGTPMQVGVGYTVRNLYDGQSLPSWPMTRLVQQVSVELFVEIGRAAFQELHRAFRNSELAHGSCSRKNTSAAVSVSRFQG